LLKYFINHSKLKIKMQKQIPQAITISVQRVSAQKQESRMKQGRSSGQGLSEYGLIAALIGVALVIALIPLGQSIAGVFSNILGTSSKTVAVARQPAGDGKPTSNLNQPLSSLGSGATTPLSNITTAVDTTSKTTIQTAGSMGTSEQVYADANKLQQIADQLKQEGADPGLIDLITRLANAGHTVGDTIAAENQKSTPSLSPIERAGIQFQNVKTELDTYLQTHPNILDTSKTSPINTGSIAIPVFPKAFNNLQIRFATMAAIVSIAPVSLQAD
jgi:Flp pilus assembly pilin Flp